MSTITQQIEALKFEREGYVTFGKDDRVADVDKQLQYWRGQRKKHGGKADAEPLRRIDKKQAIGEGVITEAEAAAKGPSTDGEKLANERAAAHASQALDVADTTVITEAEVVVTDSPEKVEERSNDLADQHASEDEPAAVDATVVTEAQVLQEVNDDELAVRPHLNGTTEDWQKFASHPDISLEVPDDAGRDQIVAAYIDKFAPGGNASKEAWVKYAEDHGIEPGDKSRDEVRAAAVDAGWAVADAPPAAKSIPKRDTADKTPRQTR